MSDKRKFGPIRQLSLQSDIRRPLLKKQLSVEHLESIEERKPPGRLDASKTNKLSDRPRPIKVAWAETRQPSRDEPPSPKSRFGDPVEVKKCKEHKRPVTAKLRTQASVDKHDKQIEKESILYTRQELAERLRKAWKDREENKQNLDIFLAQGQKQEDEEEPQVCYDRKKEVFSYIPSTTSSRPQDVRTNISVTIPIVINQSFEDPKPPEEPPLPQKDPLPEQIIKSLPPRPSTAASKRESFQKRTNTAFTGSISSPSPTPSFRPPLSRTLSTPVKSDGQKLKFIATKRRLKSARRKGKEDEQQEEGEEGDPDGGKTTKKGSRCKSAPSGELVTMVSLVSPAGSDEEQDKKEVKSRSQSPVKSVEAGKAPTLRKTGKSVSFQQSSIHTVRSFSASFPSRRAVMSALPSGSATGAMAAEREKRAPLESPPGLGETRGPKRRLVRAVSVGGDEVRVANQRTTSFDDSTSDARPRTPPVPADPKQDSVEKTTEDETSEDKENTEGYDDPSIPKFHSNKERDCWIMYKKMSDKGLPVSFDTILRGMLTPTEYRSVRKEVKAST